MAFGIDIKGMTAKLDGRFHELIDQIKKVQELLVEIRDELRTRGAPQ